MISETSYNWTKLCFASSIKTPNSLWTPLSILWSVLRSIRCQLSSSRQTKSGKPQLDALAKLDALYSLGLVSLMSSLKLQWDTSNPDHKGWGSHVLGLLSSSSSEGQTPQAGLWKSASVFVSPVAVLSLRISSSRLSSAHSGRSSACNTQISVSVDRTWH